MNSTLLIETIEGRVASLAAIAKNNQESLKFDSLSNVELINAAYYGIFWDTGIQEDWIKNIIDKTHKKKLRYDQTVLALQFLVLWKYFDDNSRIVWDQCTIPPTRLKTISRSEFISIIIGFNYLVQRKEEIDEKITQELVQSHHLKDLAISYEPDLGFKISDIIIRQLLNKSDLETELFGLILLQQNLKGERNKSLNELKLYFQILEPFLVYVTQMDISNKSLLSASLFQYLGLHRIKGYSHILESEIELQDNIQSLHPLKRAVPLILFFLLLFVETFRFYIAPNDPIIIPILLYLVLTLFWVLFGIAEDGKLKLGYLNRLTEYIINQRRDKN